MTLDEMISRLQEIKEHTKNGSLEVCVYFTNDVYSESWTVPIEFIAISSYEDNSVKVSIEATFYDYDNED